MAFDCFMYFEDPGPAGTVPEGETKDEEFSKKKAFEVYSYSWGASSPVTIGSASGGAAGGKVALSSFNVMKKADKASPIFFKTCASGGHFAKATVVLRKSGAVKGKAGTPYLTYEFKKVFVESIQWSGSAGGDDSPTESVSFVFGACEYKYWPQKADGSLGQMTNAMWSQILNKESTDVE
jgi:type VI secretion system secreted protein Hcp